MNVFVDFVTSLFSYWLYRKSSCRTVAVMRAFCFITTRLLFFSRDDSYGNRKWDFDAIHASCRAINERCM